MAKTSGCFTIVLNKEGHILLAKRKDYPLWDLPGGTLDENETLENCAIREAQEETGYVISIKQKVGEYYQPQYDDMQHLFLGELKGGSRIENGPETEKVKWFIPNKLPLLMIPNRRKQINNYLIHKDKIIKDSITVSPFKISLFKVFLRAFSKML
ncbi:NUDIX hydrolase [Falsibacillus pallidus]|uniref:ADP-ribose pyrophosphatase YjhB (NUDIX family) n=1 Tax=Falsibacillus pallidus TaxID=493781 RepID=A0A370G4Q0_9BACI|nr:NUDIX hydrolase [Falsibacillus pallidus]RDI38016.1 ADP-ribose pyrophosphatase YjhB (NUDIX family) [Falsibacillus pallidus]